MAVFCFFTVKSLRNWYDRKWKGVRSLDKTIDKIMKLINFRYFLIIVLLITGVLQFFLMLGNVQGRTYDVKPLQLAPDTIRSTKTIEDSYKTEQEKKRIVEEVNPVYVYNEAIVTQRTAIVTSLFDYVISVKKEAAASDKEVPMDEQVKQLKKKFNSIDDNEISIALSDEQLTALLSLDEKDLQYATTELNDYVKATLENPIRDNHVEDERNAIESKVRLRMNLNSKALDAVAQIARSSIVETETLDDAQTKKLIEQAKSNVEPTRILQGQIIVQEGQIIDTEMYRQLELLGMTDGKSSMKPVVGILLLILLQMSFMFILFERWDSDMRKKRNALLVTAIVYSISIVLMKILSIIATDFDFVIAFFYPTALATMLVRLLANDRAAVLVTVMTAASAGVIFQEGYSSVLQMEIALYIIFGGFASLFFMRSVEKRTHILTASGIVTVVNLLFILFYLLMTQANYGMKELGVYAIAAAVSGFMSGTLTMGLLPFFESAFGILSTLRLIELSNPNHPLLKKLLVETPGTYHHSVMVANLAEAACEEIGADGLLARVGCYYHDVGKTFRPTFFIENQMAGMNPHDAMPPEKSAEIIIAHTTDGADLLRKHKMPDEIIDIALQHHGSSLLKYFWFKAKEEGKELDESLFRYPGPKPQTTEAAVISVADSVEAAVRSMKEPTPEKIRKLVQSIIADRLNDNQFDECDISIKQLKIIEEVLCETLNGIFHSRIEYPKM